MEIQDKVIVVTGAASTGAAIAKASSNGCVRR